MPAEYTYRVSAWWTSGRTGLAKCESSPNTIHFSEAAELGGLQGRWTPEQLLLCAMAGCFTTTFHDVARSASPSSERRTLGTAAINVYLQLERPSQIASEGRMLGPP